MPSRGGSRVTQASHSYRPSRCGANERIGEIAPVVLARGTRSIMCRARRTVRDDSGMSMAPGWYPDPFSVGYVRWWDGKAWSSQTQVAPRADEPPQSAAGCDRRGAGQPRRRRTPVVVPPARVSERTSVRAAASVPAAAAVRAACPATAVRSVPAAVAVRTAAAPPYGAPPQQPPWAGYQPYPPAAPVLRSRSPRGGPGSERGSSTRSSSAWCWSRCTSRCCTPTSGTSSTAFPRDGTCARRPGRRELRDRDHRQGLAAQPARGAWPWLVYAVPQLVAYGRTLGKRVVGIRVRPLAQDRNPSWAEASVRTAVFACGQLVSGVPAARLPVAVVGQAVAAGPARQGRQDRRRPEVRARH